MIRFHTGRFHSFFFGSLLLVVCLAGWPAVARAETARGRVVDPHDRPVAMAEVILMRGTRVVTTTRTAADGRFGPLTVAPGEYEILVAAPGLRSEPTRMTVRSNAAVDVEVRLALAAVSESIVVSAAQVDLPRSRVTESVTVVSRTDLDARQTETVSDAVRVVPGFGVVASGGRGALTSFFPRGGESDYTLVVADGVPLNVFGGGFDAAHLSVAGVERIEVVRGPQSALFGGGAIGGIVHLTTRHGGPLQADALVEGGGYGTVRTSASAAGSRGVWTWGAAFDGVRTDGDTRERPALGRRVANDDYERVGASASLGWADEAGRRVRLDLRLDRDERGFPGPFGSDPLGLYGGLDLISRGANDSRALGASAVIGGTHSLRHRLQFGWMDKASQSASPFSESPSDIDTRRLTGRYQIDVEHRRVGLSAGWEWLHEREDNTFITAGAESDPVPVLRLISGWFAESRWTLRDRGFLNAGVRLERIERKALDADPSEFIERPAFSNDLVWSANPKLSAAWDVRRSGTRIRAGAGTGIKPPTAFEIAFTDNPSLRPERSRSVDVGIEQRLHHESLVADLTWFANRYDDLIVAIGSSLRGASRYRTDNVANARARGLEAGVNWRSTAGLTARAAWTWLSTEVLSVDDVPGQAPRPFVVGDPLLRRPRHQGSAEISWSSPRGRLFALVNGRGAMNDIEPNFASTIYKNPGYAVVTLGGSVNLSRFAIFGRLSNLFDREYEEAFGFPALGRSAIVGIRVTSRR